MMIPLSLEEYFDMEVCGDCQDYTEEPFYWTLPDNRVIGLCGECRLERLGEDDDDTILGQEFDGFCEIDTPTEVLW